MSIRGYHLVGCRDRDRCPGISAMRDVGVGIFLRPWRGLACGDDDVLSVAGAAQFYQNSSLISSICGGAILFGVTAEAFGVEAPEPGSALTASTSENSTIMS